MKVYQVTRTTDNANRWFFPWDKQAMKSCINEIIKHWGKESVKVEVLKW